MRTKDFIYLFLFIFIFTPFLFANEDENPKTFNLVMIANDKMINIIKDNQIIILIKIKYIYYCL